MCAAPTTGVEFSSLAQTVSYARQFLSWNTCLQPFSLCRTGSGGEVHHSSVSGRLHRAIAYIVCRTSFSGEVPFSSARGQLRHASAVVYVPPALVIKYISPAQAVSYSTPASVVECVSPGTSSCDEVHRSCASGTPRHASTYGVCRRRSSGGVRFSSASEGYVAPKPAVQSHQRQYWSTSRQPRQSITPRKHLQCLPHQPQRQRRVTLHPSQRKTQRQCSALHPQ